MPVTNIRAAFFETLVLSLLAERPMHGYELGTEIERRSGGFFTFKHGTLYPVLHRLEARGLIRGKWTAGGTERPRKYYELTRRGVRGQRDSAAEWRALISRLAVLIPGIAR